MDNQYISCKIIIDGIVPGNSPDQVQKHLAKLFKTNPSRFKTLKNGKSIEIIKHAGLTKAKKYRLAIEKTGCLVSIQTCIQTKEPSKKPHNQNSKIIKCPKCGIEQPPTDECVQCGVIIQKYLLLQKKNSMATAKTCPLCKKQIAAKSTKCPECKKELPEHWEVKKLLGTTSFYFGNEIKFDNIRTQLISGTLKLSDKYRIYNNSLVDKKEWRTMREYTDGIDELKILYAPVQVCSRLGGLIGAMLVGPLIAIGWVTAFLLTFEVNIIIACILSILLIILTPTVIGFFLGAVVVGAIYSIPISEIGFSILAAALAGFLAAFIIGYPIGALFGALTGIMKKKII